MNPSFYPDDRHADDSNPDGFNELSTPNTEIKALTASMESFVNHIRLALEQEELVFRFDGTETAKLGSYLRNANDEADLRTRSSIVWGIFDNALKSAPEIAEMAAEPVSYFAGSIIQDLAISLVTMKCNVALQRVNLEVGMEVGPFLSEVHDRNFRLVYLTGDTNTLIDNRVTEMATIREGLKLSGEKSLGKVITQYQKYAAEFNNHVNESVNEIREDGYLLSRISLRADSIANLKNICIEECSSVFEGDLNDSLKKRVDQVFDALVGVGAIKEGEMLLPRSS